jgi:plasmid stabilization system protein ParE
MSIAIYDVIIYPSAESDLYDIKQYFEQVLKTSPSHLFQRFYDSIEYLEKNPFMYPLVKDPFLCQLGYHMIPIDNFLIFYIVTSNEVQIHRFLYGKRNYLLIL